MDILQLLWTPISLLLHVVEHLLFKLITWYDAYCYSPLQTVLSPWMAQVPRSVEIRGHKIDVFTANIVSWSRTALVIPIAWCLKYNFPVTAFLCVIFHDFLDHVDGIVAKVQKTKYGELDDPLLGGFMDAFCDKIVNCVSLWTILVVTDFSQMTPQQTCLFTAACAIIIAYEFILGIVRVQDYFQAFYERKHGIKGSDSSPNVAAVMEGKLKEKLESMGIGCLCLAQGCVNPAQSISGIIGLICLLLSIRLAHASLEHKLKPRRKKAANNGGKISTATESKLEKIETGIQTEKDEVPDPASIQRHMSIFDENISDDDEGEKSDVSEKDLIEDHLNQQQKTRPTSALTRSHSVPSWKLTVTKVDKVYTVGCFDLFHDGHRILMERLGALGKQVIVGVHDSRSIFKLKKKVPIDSTTKRMSNVKKFANVVFCIHGTDPTPYLKCMYDADEDCTSMYVRGDDMPNFPARKFIESVMPVHFLPYTEYVSSTKIRKEVYNASMFGPHVSNDDEVDHGAMFY